MEHILFYKTFCKNLIKWYAFYHRYFLRQGTELLFVGAQSAAVDRDKRDVKIYEFFSVFCIIFFGILIYYFFLESNTRNGNFWISRTQAISEMGKKNKNSNIAQCCIPGRCAMCTSTIIIFLIKSFSENKRKKHTYATQKPREKECVVFNITCVDMVDFIQKNYATVNAGETGDILL